MSEAVVVRKHQSNYPNPVSFSVGDELLVGKADTLFHGDAAYGAR